MVNQPTLGQLIKEARRAVGLTQEALAAHAGLSARAISDLERGVSHVPRPSTLQLLVSALNLSEQERDHFEAVARLHEAELSSVGDPTAPAHAEVGSRPVLTTSDAPRLIGRYHEMALLQQHLAGDGPPLLVLGGEPGIGKTRLLHEAAMLAETHGLSVLRGTVPEPGEHNSLDPIADSVRRAIRGRAPVHLRRDLQGCAWLVRMLPELVSGPIEKLSPDTSPPEPELPPIGSAVLRYIANTAGRSGTLLILDNLHAADASALALLARLVRAQADVPLRVLGAYRDGHCRGGDALSKLLAMLAHEQAVRHAALTPLSPNESARLLSAAMGRVEQPPVSPFARVVHDSGGVPFYLVAWGRELGSFAQWSASAQLPWSIQQSVQHRVDAGPPAARRVLEALAVAGGRATYALLVALVAQADQEVLTALDWSVRERLLDEDGQAYVFAYGVIRTAVEADLSHARRVLLQRRLAAVDSRDVERRRPQTPTDRRGTVSQVPADNERAHHLTVLRRGPSTRND